MNNSICLLAGEISGDLHGASLIQELRKIDPTFHISAVAGPRMRACGVDSFLDMEQLQSMGFLDLIGALPRLTKLFFFIRNKILQLQPQAVIFIDYPGLHLRLASSLRKKSYRGKLIHYICPTVWAWGKKRIPLMEENLDLLLTIFPFEKECFSKEKLSVHYVGHPLTQAISPPSPRAPLLALFPGSRPIEIARNLPLQLRVAEKINPQPRIVISLAHPDLAPQIRALTSLPLTHQTYELMRTCHLAIATSGTITLELALHHTPTVVTYAIRPLDVWLAQKVFRIHLPHYCIVNIIASGTIFPELFGPHLTEQRLWEETKELWFNQQKREACIQGCDRVCKLLGTKEASREAAEKISTTIWKN